MILSLTTAGLGDVDEQDIQELRQLYKERPANDNCQKLRGQGINVKPK